MSNDPIASPAPGAASSAGAGPGERADDERALFRLLAGWSAGEGPFGGPALKASVLPGPYGRGPWDHGLLHGGPVGGLAGWAAEQAVPAADGLLCCRLTVELLSGVPAMEPIEVTATVVKPGRRSRAVDVTATSGGRAVMRATSQWVLPSAGWDTPAGPAPARPVGPSDPSLNPEVDYPRPEFNCDAAELRFVSGSTESSGPAVVWARLTSPLMAGQPLTPLVMAATVADLAAAAGWEHEPDQPAFINPDLSLHLNRYPQGPWICIDARNHRSAGAVAFNEATFSDDRGPFGRVLQSLVEAPGTIQSLAP